MKSVFDIIGPVMIGPSSSHTAGAVRLGRVARSLLGEELVQAEITLYGSFAQTYRGHGTDRALVGGLLGLDTDDSNIKIALNTALAKGLEVCFKIETAEKKEKHANTASIVLNGISGKTVNVEGCSVGGGNILINKINNFDVYISCTYPTLLVEHADKPGVIGKVTAYLGENGINIASVKMSRKYKGANNLMVIETDQPISDNILKIVNTYADIGSAIKIQLV